MFSITRKNLILNLIGMAMSCCLRNDNYPENYSLEIQDCFIRNSESGMLDIITWNVHQIPVNENEILARFSSMINASGADIIALQEAGIPDEFSNLMAALPEYDGYINGISEQNPAFLVKKNSPVNASSRHLVTMRM